MKKLILLVFPVLPVTLLAQQTPEELLQQQLEYIAEKDEAIIEDDALLHQLEVFRKHPLNLNHALADELQQLQLLTDVQIQSLLQYRNLLGKLVHVYELQAVPYWDVTTIRRLLPYVTVQDEAMSSETLLKRFRGGAFTASLLAAPEKAVVRYRYNYKNLLRYGVLADKDPGEPFFGFYSAHLFVSGVGIIQSLAIGDFTVNLGQGLIHWQSLAFPKSTDITRIKRQAAVLRPHTSAGESNFHRGAGITLKRKKIALTIFGSVERTLGGSLLYEGGNWRAGLNYIRYTFREPPGKRDEPYNLFAIKGRNWANYSIHYDHTYRNVHLFGEMAAGPLTSVAMLNGVLVSLHRSMDLSLVMRRLPPAFQSFNASAFTESTVPSNETGMFIGVSFRPFAGWRLDCFADVYRFPWLRYRRDAPATGREYLVQLGWKPDKKLECITRFRTETGQINFSHATFPLPALIYTTRWSWRTHFTWQLTSDVRLQQRVELVRFRAGSRREEGYLIYNDVQYRWPGGLFKLDARVQLFETGGFDSRITAYESDVPGSYSVPFFYNKGMRCYLNAGVDLNQLFAFRKTVLQGDIWVRFALKEYKLGMIFR